MRALVPTLLVLPLFLAAACGGPKVQAPPPTPSDLAGRLTYAWAPTADLPGRLGTRERLRLLDTTLRGAVDEEMGRRGYQQIATGEVDLLVTYRVILQDKTPSSLRDYAEYRNTGGQLSAGKVLGGYTEAILIIELLDGRNGQAIWRSSAQAIPDVSGKGERIPGLVREMMAPLPPRP